MAGMSSKISNILGVKLPDTIYDQLVLRAEKNSLDDRKSNDNPRYLDGKTAWVRLVSSVNLLNQADKAHFNSIGAAFDGSDSGLAKEFTLFAGTSKYLDAKKNALRSGILDVRNPSPSSYGMLGDYEIERFGYRPMPGIVSVNINTQGRLGSVRAATINFKCWDKAQLDIMDALYFKLGYTMFLEWGHTYYYASKPFNIDTGGGNVINISPNQLHSTEIFSVDPFDSKLNKEELMLKIAKNVELSEGNYDAMLGMCTNFNFTYNQEGGYDCTLKLMSLGVLADSTKINHTSTIPGILDEQVKLYNKLLAIAKAEAEKKAAEEEAKARAEKAAFLLKYYNNATSNSGAGTGYKLIIVLPGDKYDQKSFEEFLKDQDLTVDQFEQITNRKFDPNVAGPADGFAKFRGDPEQSLNYTWGSDDDLKQESKITYSTLTLKSVIDNSSKTGLCALLPRFNAIVPSISMGLTKDAAKCNFFGVKNYTGKAFTISTGTDTLKLNINKTPAVAGVSFNVGFTRYLASDPTAAKSREFKSELPQHNITLVYPRILNGKPDATHIYYFSVTQYGVAQPVDESGEPITQITYEIDGEEETVDLENVIKELDQGGAAIDRWNVKDGLYYNSYEDFINALTEESSERFMETEFNIQLASTVAPGKDDATISRFLSSSLNSSFDESYGKEQQVVWNPTKRANSFALDYTETTNGPMRFGTSPGTYYATGNLFRKLRFRKRVTKKDDEEVDFFLEVRMKYSLYVSSNDWSYIKKMPPGRGQPSDFGGSSTTAFDGGGGSIEDVEGLNVEAQPVSIDSQKSPLSYLSAIEVALRAIQVKSLIKVLELKTGTSVNVIPLHAEVPPAGEPSFINQIFDNGVFTGYIKDLLDGNVYTPADYKSEDKKFAVRAQYGFATSLMAGYANVAKLEPVDYKLLLTSYVLPYQINQSMEEGTPLQHPVYISFGFFLMLLNHNCILYDSKEKGKSTPLSYIDFNPEHNFCLTNKQHLTTDPFTALIPFEGTNEDFKSIIDPEVIADNGTDIKSPSVAPQTEGDTSPDNQNKKPEPTPIWTPQSPADDVRDQVSSALRQAAGSTKKYSFKHEIADGKISSYRGKTMNILLNLDYLIGLIKAQAKKSEENRVTLKPIIEQILSDLNKCLGNINVFRLSYVDAGNVYQITDDQVIPPPAGGGETTLNSRGKQSPLPLVGKTSIAKSLDIKTEVSSKLSNMIAISANSKDKQSTLGSAGDNFAGYINENFQDRYIPVRSEPQNNSSSLDGKINTAVQFNNAVKSFYNSLRPDQGSVSAATTYYVDRMVAVKGKDPATRASAMIPISLNFKTNGISGMAMGHAFTVPEMLLPYTYGQMGGGKTDRVGFVVTGLDHTIEGNTWDTAIKSQMIFLKNPDDYTDSPAIEERASSTGLGGPAGEGGGAGASFLAAANIPLQTSAEVKLNLKAVKAALIAQGITNKRLIIAALANVMKETAGQIIEENLHYVGKTPQEAADRMITVFGDRARRLANTPTQGGKSNALLDIVGKDELIAEAMYGYKSGTSLGNDQPGDGWKFRGRGFIGITGKAVYSAYSELLFGDKNKLINDPTLLNNRENSAAVTAIYMKKRIGPAADRCGIKISDNMSQADANIVVTSAVGGVTLNREGNVKTNEIWTEIMNKVDGRSKAFETDYDQY